MTEHGAPQAANLLNSPRAVEMSLYVVRAFVHRRELLSSNQELAKRLDQLEARIEKKLATHDEAIATMLSAIRELTQRAADIRFWRPQDRWSVHVLAPTRAHSTTYARLASASACV